MLREPRHAELQVDEICKLSNVAKATYYNAFKDQNFLAHLEAEMSAYRSANDFAVMHNLAEQAKTTKNHNMIALYQRLQNRLKEGGEKPAQIILVFNEQIVRPKWEDPNAKAIDAEFKEVPSED